MTENVYEAVGRSTSAPRSGSHPANKVKRTGYSSDTVMYTRWGAQRADEIFNMKKKSSPTSDGEENSRISSKGKEKMGEVRKEAGQRRRFVERRRGLVLALMIAIMFAVVVGLIYKVVFVVKDITVVGDSVYTPEMVIEASGIGERTNLYSFRGSSVESRITLSCPYIKSVDVNREMPSDVTLTIVSDSPKYYADIYGEIKLISADLRVLDTVSKDSVPEGLIKLKLPSVAYAVSGRVIKFTDEKRDRGVREVLSAAIDSGVSDRVTTIDLRDQFDLSIVCDGKFKLILGDKENILRKLKTAEKVLEDEMFTTDNKIRVDLTLDGKTGVMIDNKMELD